MKNLVKVCLLAFVLALGIGEALGQFVWTKDARNPVFSGVNGTWSTGVFDVCVLFNTDSSRYEMWFDACPGPNSDPGWRPYSVGFAVSKDGINWTMPSPSPVLTLDAGKWDNYTAESPEVIRENGQYKMWYISWVNSTSPNYLGYATSPDGVHWTKYSGNPVFGPGTAAWEAGGPSDVSIIPFQGGYKMWYTGLTATFAGNAIGYATSVDGINWKRDTVHSPVLNVGASGQWDDAGVGISHVLGIGDSLYMWYTSGVKMTGVAVSKDGITNWKKSAANPVLVPGVAWDAQRACAGTVLLVGDTLHMWYDGWRTPYTSYQYSIGHAWSKVVVNSVPDGQRELPRQFMLAQNYPNPFNPSTTIKYELPKASEVRLSVYDLLGREVSVLVNEKRDAGVHEVKFNGANLASGVYFYRLRAGDFVQSKRLVLLK